jgi:hypothetical protein
MNNYLVCSNPKCRFVLDVRLHGSKANHRRLSPASCYLCGAKWSSSHPMSLSAVRAHASVKLPPVSPPGESAHGAAA